MKRVAQEAYENSYGADYWGDRGAGILAIAEDTGNVLVALRSDYVNEPGTWGTVGGKVDNNESFEEAAIREFEEETGYAGPIDLIPGYKFVDGPVFEYQNFIGVVPEEFETEPTTWETSMFEWIPVEKLKNLAPKHRGLDAFIHADFSKLQDIVNKPTDNVHLHNAIILLDSGILAPEKAGKTARDKEDEIWPLAGETVSGLRVTNNIPNMDSIAATFENYRILDGIREVPVDSSGLTEEMFPTDIVDLAEQIKENGWIDPLIVAVDSSGEYILEGAHRHDALMLLGVDAIPALVVMDEDEFGIDGVEQDISGLESRRFVAQLFAPKRDPYETGLCNDRLAPWQMTKQEYLDSCRGISSYLSSWQRYSDADPTDPKTIQEAERVATEMHKRDIQDALYRGDPIPEEVLADYPEFTQMQEPLENVMLSDVNFDDIRKPNHVYRGMSKEEFDLTVGAGNGVYSDKRCSFKGEGTCFGTHPKTALSYALGNSSNPNNTGVPVYIVEVSSTEELMFKDHDEYIKTKDVDLWVPQEYVTRIFEVDSAGDDYSITEVGLPIATTAVWNKTHKIAMKKLAELEVEDLEIIYDLTYKYGWLNALERENDGWLPDKAYMMKAQIESDMAKWIDHGIDGMIDTYSEWLDFHTRDGWTNSILESVAYDGLEGILMIFSGWTRQDTAAVTQEAVEEILNKAVFEAKFGNRNREQLIGQDWDYVTESYGSYFLNGIDTKKDVLQDKLDLIETDWQADKMSDEEYSEKADPLVDQIQELEDQIERSPEELIEEWDLEDAFTKYMLEETDYGTPEWYAELYAGTDVELDSVDLETILHDHMYDVYLENFPGLGEEISGIQEMYSRLIQVDASDDLQEKIITFQEGLTTAHHHGTMADHLLGVQVGTGTDILDNLSNQDTTGWDKELSTAMGYQPAVQERPRETVYEPELQRNIGKEAGSHLGTAMIILAQFTTQSGG